MELETIFKTDWPLETRITVALIYSAVFGAIYAINVAFHERRRDMTKEQRKAEDEAIKNAAIYNMDMTDDEMKHDAER